MDRRQFLIASGTAVVAGMLLPGIASAVPISLGSGTPVDLNALSRVPTLDELQDRGTEAPYMAEIALARKILALSPTNCRPIDVANYFLSVKNGEMDDVFGSDTSSYCDEWPVRANPIIVSFFDATLLRKPEGDQTAWCAAFINWCIERSRQGKTPQGKLLPSTQSAASASFRSWANETKSPTIGDLVVFKHKNQTNGHVGFFAGADEKGIYVLGGNQMPLRARLPGGTYERKNTGEVNVKLFPYAGKDLSFHSFRTDASLHSI